MQDLEVEETPIEGEIFKATTCGQVDGSWNHYLSLGILIFLPPISIEVDPFIIEVRK